MSDETASVDWREDAEELRLGRIHKAFNYVPLSLYDEVTKLAEYALGEYIDEIDRLTDRIEELERLLRETNLDATDSDGMFPRNPLL